MNPRIWAVALTLGLLAGCSAREQRTARVVPEVATAPASQHWRQLAEDAIEGASDAVSNGSTEEFEACEAVLLTTIAEAERRNDFTAEDAEWTTQTLEELGRLQEEIAQAGAPPAEDQAFARIETPPEPGPVPEDAIEETRERAQKERYNLPIVINSQVTSLIGYYTGPYRERLKVAMSRGSEYIDFIQTRLREAGLPTDLAYLPLVESAFNTRARSRASAQGVWQFVRGTARLYGLRVDGLVDERSDPYLATQAAVAHLADLYAEFNDWELALAAYNSGSGRVRRALRRSRKGKDFWSIRRYLPRETRNYVPAFWAALVVAKNPEGYGLPPWRPVNTCLSRIPVAGALDLEVLAERIELTADELADFNPGLIHRLTPPKGTYRIAVPCGQEETITAAINSIPPNKRVRRYIHTVRRGDTLSVLARRYGSSVRTIMAANGIRNPRRLRIGQKLVIPRTVSTRGHTYVAQARPDRYVVRRGDTLYGIARRYGTTVDAIKRRNGLGGSLIRPGDVLLMP